MHLDTTVMINKIADYMNGNVHTELFSDGTKIHTTEDDEFKFEFPESIDLHISSKCNNGCPMCYANCTPKGEVAEDLLTFGLLDETLRPGTELAVNLNFPMHYDFFSFAESMKRKGVILNATVNQNHFESREDIIKELYDQNLIRGIGVSLTKATPEFVRRIKNYPNAVIHVINGIFSANDLEVLKDQDLKILILGYKNKGRGVNYLEDDENELSYNIRSKWLRENLESISDHFKVVCFDNLALEQLPVRSLLTDKQWEEFYAGDDGTVSMYLNLVDKFFARNSMTDVHYVYKPGMTIDYMFKVIQDEIRNKT